MHMGFNIFCAFSMKLQLKLEDILLPRESLTGVFGHVKDLRGLLAQEGLKPTNQCAAKVIISLKEQVCRSLCDIQTLQHRCALEDCRGRMLLKTAAAAAAESCCSMQLQHAAAPRLQLPNTFSLFSS